MQKGDIINEDAKIIDVGIINHLPLICKRGKEIFSGVQPVQRAQGTGLTVKGFFHRGSPILLPGQTELRMQWTRGFL